MKISVALILGLLILASCSKKHEFTNQKAETNTIEDWENPEVYARNKEQPRATFIPFLLKGASASK